MDQKEKTEKFKARQRRYAKSHEFQVAQSRAENRKTRERDEQMARLKRHAEIEQKTSLKARYAAMDAKYGVVENTTSNVPTDIQNMITDMTEKATPEQRKEVQEMADNAFADNRR